MNILYTNCHKQEGGGHTTYILSLCTDGRQNKFVACPASSALYRKLQERGFKNLIDLSFPSKPREWREIITSVRRLKEVIREHNIDLVHTSNSPDNRLALYASLGFGRKFGVIFTKHNPFRISGLVSQWRFNHFNDAVIFVGSSIHKTIGIPRITVPVHVIENGIDLDHWRRQAPYHTGSRIRLVSTAGISLHKGWTNLVEAIAGLSEEEKSRLSVTMPAPLELEDTLAWAKERCDITFPGYAPDPRPHLENADVGFVLSRSETISFACREMMAMGLPMIVSTCGNLPDNVDAGCGWVTPTGDVPAIRDALRHILAMSPEDINVMKANARKKAEAEFSLETMREKTDAVYRETFARLFPNRM